MTRIIYCKASTQLRICSPASQCTRVGYSSTASTAPTPPGQNHTVNTSGAAALPRNYPNPSSSGTCTSMEYIRTSIIIRNGTNPLEQQKPVRFRPRPRLLQLTLQPELPRPVPGSRRVNRDLAYIQTNIPYPCLALSTHHHQGPISGTDIRDRYRTYLGVQRRRVATPSW